MISRLLMVLILSIPGLALCQEVSLVELLSNSPASKSFEVGRFIEQGVNTGIIYANATVKPDNAPISLDFNQRQNALIGKINTGNLSSFLGKPLQIFYFLGMTRQYSKFTANAITSAPSDQNIQFNIQIELNGQILEKMPIPPGQPALIETTIPPFERNQSHLVVLIETTLSNMPSGPIAITLEHPKVIQ